MLLTFLRGNNEAVAALLKIKDTGMDCEFAALLEGMNSELQAVMPLTQAKARKKYRMMNQTTQLISILNS